MRCTYVYTPRYTNPFFEYTSVQSCYPTVTLVYYKYVHKQPLQYMLVNTNIHLI